MSSSQYFITQTVLFDTVFNALFVCFFPSLTVIRMVVDSPASSVSLSC